MLSSSLDINSNELLNVVNEYTKALSILDDYDHQVLTKPIGNKLIYELKYYECRNIIDSMRFGEVSNVFGVEKEAGKLNGMLIQIYQYVFRVELYPTIEEKAAHLLYFLVKDHPFVDGCKRIAATLLLQFLNKNKSLVKNGKVIISNDALVAITLLTAESKPEEMEIIIKVIMNLLVDYINILSVALKKANFKIKPDLTAIEFFPERNLNRELIANLSSGVWISQGKNLVIISATAT